jgi:L-serine dehydratase
LRLANDEKLGLWEIVLKSEMSLTGLPESMVFERLDKHYEVMIRSASIALFEDYSLCYKDSLISGTAHKQNVYAGKTDTIGGEFINRVMARALSCSEVNASMGKICAAPTAGACGVLPAVLISVGEKYELERKDILKGLLTASGIGAVFMKNATVSGAEGGCQAECGVAAAMASAAAVQMVGGSNEASINAVCFSIMNCMGLICDPVAGLVQFPCAQRNASQAVNAVLSADLALAGMKSIIPVDEVIEAMYKTGRSLPVELKETALGGVAATASAKAIALEIFS